MSSSTLASDILTIDVTDQFYVTNNTDTPIIHRWDGQRIVLQPRIKIPVPFDIVRLYYGDPRSEEQQSSYSDPRTHQTGMIPSRESELRRLATFYGLYDHQINDLAHTVPNVTIETLDGVEIFPPAYDPTGEYQYGHIEEDRNVQDVAQMMRRLQKSVDSQQAELDRLREWKSALEVGGEEAEIPVDSPPVLR